MPTPPRTSVFMYGHRQAHRTPKELRFTGSDVEIVREGDRVVLIPVRDAWSVALIDRLNRPGQRLEWPTRSRTRLSIDLDGRVGKPHELARHGPGR